MLSFYFGVTLYLNPFNPVTNQTNQNKNNVSYFTRFFQFFELIFSSNQFIYYSGDRYYRK